MKGLLDRDRWREITQTITENWFWSMVTGFGVFWGILLIIILMGAGNGLQKGISQTFDMGVTNSVYIWGGSTAKPYRGMSANRRVQLNNADVRAIQGSIEGIDIIAPRNQLGGYGSNNNIVRGLQTGSFTVYGDYPDHVKIKPVDFLKGRMINEIDIMERRKVAVIGDRVLATLFTPEEEPIGEMIQVNGINFTVIGVFSPKGMGGDSQEDSESIKIPFSTFQQAFNYGERVGWLAFSARDDISSASVEKEVRKLLYERHTIHPDDRRALGGYNAEKEFRKMQSLFSGINLLCLFIGLMSLIAGCVGVSNIMLILVKERTREIGVRRALGATPIQILSQLVMESVVLTMLAGILGFIIGIWLLEYMGAAMAGDPEAMVQNPEVEIAVIIQAFIILVVSGALAGLIPAIQALKVKPVDALRYE